ncbi:unnamed protein product [Vitrella brassicaformis CCMP3155]|uniref:Uncharacterized protein n=1 Tax=Vitrella brassicaformis (strain CCMP3155) TaxID=1169540 RepID=A0A0G4EM93_VITBC|nr:unnamed protein product [Vitrella brassicaformis CCMP3155]|eukprot:CEL98279.1 unnamed protein product [Vitrella brassicaformis CCMP3155]
MDKKMFELVRQRGVPRLELLGHNNYLFDRKLEGTATDYYQALVRRLAEGNDDAFFNYFRRHARPASQEEWEIFLRKLEDRLEFNRQQRQQLLEERDAAEKLTQSRRSDQVDTPPPWLTGCVYVEEPMQTRAMPPSPPSKPYRRRGDMNDEGSDTVPLIDTYGRASSVRYHRLLMPGGQYTYI